MYYYIIEIVHEVHLTNKQQSASANKVNGISDIILR